VTAQFVFFTERRSLTACKAAEHTMVNCTEFLQKRLCCLVANRPKEAVSYAWMTSLVCSALPQRLVLCDG